MLTFGKGNLRVPKLSRNVYIVAAGMTDFRKFYPEKQTVELCLEAIRMAVMDGLGMEPKKFLEEPNYCVHSQFADHFGDQLLAAAKVHDYAGFDPLGNIEVKTGGATGGSAAQAAIMAVASGVASCVPVIGWERMDEVSTRQGNSYIASAACKDFEYELGRSYNLLRFANAKIYPRKQAATRNACKDRTKKPSLRALLSVFAVAERLYD